MPNIFGRQDRYEAVVEFDQAKSQPSVRYRASQQEHTLLVSTSQPGEKYYWLSHQVGALTLGLPSPVHLHGSLMWHVLTHGTHSAHTSCSSPLLPSCNLKDGREAENMKRLKNPGQM